MQTGSGIKKLSELNAAGPHITLFSSSSFHYNNIDGGVGWGGVYSSQAAVGVECAHAPQGCVTFLQVPQFSPTARICAGEANGLVSIGPVWERCRCEWSCDGSLSSPGWVPLASWAAERCSSHHPRHWTGIIGLENNDLPCFLFLFLKCMYNSPLFPCLILKARWVFRGWCFCDQKYAVGT